MSKDQDKKRLILQQRYLRLSNPSSTSAVGKGFVFGDKAVSDRYSLFVGHTRYLLEGLFRQNLSASFGEYQFMTSTDEQIEAFFNKLQLKLSRKSGPKNSLPLEQNQLGSMVQIQRAQLLQLTNKNLMLSKVVQQYQKESGKTSQVRGQMELDRDKRGQLGDQEKLVTKDRIQIQAARLQIGKLKFELGQYGQEIANMLNQRRKICQQFRHLAQFRNAWVPGATLSQAQFRINNCVRQLVSNRSQAQPAGLKAQVQKKENEIKGMSQIIDNLNQLLKNQQSQFNNLRFKSNQLAKELDNKMGQLVRANDNLAKVQNQFMRDRQKYQLQIQNNRSLVLRLQNQIEEAKGRQSGEDVKVRQILSGIQKQVLRWKGQQYGPKHLFYVVGLQDLSFRELTEEELFKETNILRGQVNQLRNSLKDLGFKYEQVSRGQKPIQAQLARSKQLQRVNQQLNMILNQKQKNEQKERQQTIARQNQLAKLRTEVIRLQGIVKKQQLQVKILNKRVEPQVSQIDIQRQNQMQIAFQKLQIEFRGLQQLRNKQLAEYRQLLAQVKMLDEQRKADQLAIGQMRVELRRGQQLNKQLSLKLQNNISKTKPAENKESHQYQVKLNALQSEIKQLEQTLEYEHKNKTQLKQNCSRLEQEKNQIRISFINLQKQKDQLQYSKVKQHQAYNQLKQQFNQINSIKSQLQISFYNLQMKNRLLQDEKKSQIEHNATIVRQLNTVIKSLEEECLHLKQQNKLKSAMQQTSESGLRQTLSSIKYKQQIGKNKEQFKRNNLQFTNRIKQLEGKIKQQQLTIQKLLKKNRQGQTLLSQVTADKVKQQGQIVKNMRNQLAVQTIRFNELLRAKTLQTQQLQQMLITQSNQYNLKQEECKDLLQKLTVQQSKSKDLKQRSINVQDFRLKLNLLQSQCKQLKQQLISKQAKEKDIIQKLSSQQIQCKQLRSRLKQRQADNQRLKQKQVQYKQIKQKLKLKQIDCKSKQAELSQLKFKIESSDQIMRNLKTREEDLASALSTQQKVNKALQQLNQKYLISINQLKNQLRIAQQELRLANSQLLKLFEKYKTVQTQFQRLQSIADKTTVNRRREGSVSQLIDELNRFDKKQQILNKGQPKIANFQQRQQLQIRIQVPAEQSKIKAKSFDSGDINTPIEQKDGVLSKIARAQATRKQARAQTQISNVKQETNMNEKTITPVNYNGGSKSVVIKESRVEFKQGVTKLGDEENETNKQAKMRIQLKRNEIQSMLSRIKSTTQLDKDSKKEKKVTSFKKEVNVMPALVENSQSKFKSRDYEQRLLSQFKKGPQEESAQLLQFSKVKGSDSDFLATKQKSKNLMNIINSYKEGQKQKVSRRVEQVDKVNRTLNVGLTEYTPSTAGEGLMEQFLSSIKSIRKDIQRKKKEDEYI